MEKVYLYTFKDNSDCGCKDYHFITKHDCKQLLQDIEDNWFKINEIENINEIVEILKQNNADTRFVEFIKNERNLDFSSTYEFEQKILSDLGELIAFDEETFYY